MRRSFRSSSDDKLPTLDTSFEDFHERHHEEAKRLAKLDHGTPDHGPLDPGTPERASSLPVIGSASMLNDDSVRGSIEGPSGIISWHHTRKSLKFITEDDFKFFEEEQTVVETKIPPEIEGRYSENWCCICFKPRTALHNEVKALRVYRQSLQKVYQGTLKWIEWLQLPGREHEKAKGHNYLAYQLWLLTYATTSLPSETLKKLDESTIQNLEESLVLAESMAVSVKKYFDILRRFIRTARCLIEEMNKIAKVPPTNPENNPENPESTLDVLNLLTELENSQQKSIYSGNRIRHFAKLRVYTREPSTKKWHRFADASVEDQVKSVKSGFLQFNSKIKSMNKTIEDPLLKLRKAFLGNCECCFSQRKSFIPHLVKMESYLQKIFRTEMTPSDEEVLKCFLNEVTEHIQYIFETGQSIVAKTKEILYYTRLCYHYLIEVCEIPAQPYETLIQKNFSEKEKSNLIPYDAIESVDFFDVAAPDTLRRVPVIFNVKDEWALHYDGFKNTSREASVRQSVTYDSSIRMRQSLRNAMSHNPAMQSIRMDLVTRLIQADVRKSRTSHVGQAMQRS